MSTLLNLTYRTSKYSFFRLTIRCFVNSILYGLTCDFSCLQWIRKLLLVLCFVGVVGLLRTWRSDKIGQSYETRQAIHNRCTLEAVSTVYVVVMGGLLCKVIGMNFDDIFTKDSLNFWAKSRSSETRFCPRFSIRLVWERCVPPRCLKWFSTLHNLGWKNDWMCLCLFSRCFIS